MAIKATFSGGVLKVLDDPSDNTIIISRDVPGNLFVNAGAVPIQGGAPTVGTTSRIEVQGSAGNDTIALDETNGPLPPASLSGGAGNDSLTGGSGDDSLFGDSGNDVLIGKRGNDSIFGGGGDDLFVWNPGDGSDAIDGGTGFDTLRFNGSNANEHFEISANGAHARFTRDVANIVMDLNGLERIDINAL